MTSQISTVALVHFGDGNEFPKPLGAWPNTPQGIAAARAKFVAMIQHSRKIHRQDLYSDDTIDDMWKDGFGRIYMIKSCFHMIQVLYFNAEE